MKFFSKKLCEKLQKLGCRSSSNHYWVWDVTGKEKFANPISEGHLNSLTFSEESKNYRCIDAFFQNDFTGCHEQAKENAKIVWGNIETYNDYTGNINNSWDFHRHEMIDAPDAEEFILATMKEARSSNEK